MSIRKDTKNRLTLFRACQTCGRSIVTTADTPFMRQMTNIGGKKQKTVFFCSEKCKKASYKHLFDGKAEERRKEREAKRDHKAKAKRYYAAHTEECRERAHRWRAKHPEEVALTNAYNRKKRKLRATEGVVACA